MYGRNVNMDDLLQALETEITYFRRWMDASGGSTRTAIRRAGLCL
jgi:hypothetical protein